MAGVFDIWKDAASICCSGSNLLQQRYGHLLRNSLPSQGTQKKTKKIELPIKLVPYVLWFLERIFLASYVAVTAFYRAFVPFS
jgi:hypothetical protein